MSWCCCNGAKFAIITPLPACFNYSVPQALPCGHQCPVCQQQTVKREQIHQEVLVNSASVPSSQHNRSVEANGNIGFNRQLLNLRQLDNPAQFENLQTSFPSREFYSIPRETLHSLSSGSQAQASRSGSVRQPISRNINSLPAETFYSLPSGSQVQTSRSCSVRQPIPRNINSLPAETFYSLPSGSQVQTSRSGSVRQPIFRNINPLPTETFYSLPTESQIQEPVGKKIRRPLQTLPRRSNASTNTSTDNCVCPGRPPLQIYEDRNSRTSSSRPIAPRVTFIGNEGLNQSRIHSGMPVSVNYNSLMSQMKPQQLYSQQRQALNCNAVYVPNRTSIRTTTFRRPVVAHKNVGNEVVVNETRKEITENLVNGNVKRTVSTVSATYSSEG